MGQRKIAYAGSIGPRFYKRLRVETASRRRLRLAVVASAYDLVAPTGMKPEKSMSLTSCLCCEDNILRGNQDLFETVFYGISAQGGRYASPSC